MRAPMRTTLPGLLLALLSSGAYASGYSTDTELVKPSFSPDTVPGLETSEITAPGAYRTGVALQYLRDPLIIKLYGEDAGSVVNNRIAATAGFSYDAKKWLSLRATLPVAFQFGSDIPDYSADGFAVADMRLGARAALPSGGIFHPGLRVDLDVPTGKDLAYVSEESVRFTGGVLATLDLGPATILLDGGFTGRQEVDTPADFVLGSELVLNGGVMLHLWPERISVGTAVLSRGGSKNLWKGGAENAAEVFTDAQIRLTRHLQLDVGVGRGLTTGYGTTGFRTLAAITYIYAPPPPPPEIEPDVTVAEIIKPPPEPIFEEPVDRPWEEGQTARVNGLNIEIRDPILFEFGTPVIRDVSFPTLKGVAEILQTYGQIDHLLVEGHASEEGSFEYNYNLSTARAQSIYNKLIEYGIHPSRISFRGMGEVAPVMQGDSEEALAANRRVNFLIIKLLDPLAPIPNYPATIKLPWSGEEIKASQPGAIQIGSAPPPGTRAQPTDQQKEKMQEDFFKTTDDDGDDWAVPKGTQGGTEGGTEGGDTKKEGEGDQ